jgi:hypothetical protein
MTERINRCLESGCQAVCCRKVWLTSDYDIKQVRRIFPEARQVSYYDFFDKHLLPGVYMQKLLWNGKCKVRIVEDCPRLKENNCTIWDKERLSDCEGVVFDSEECKLLRLG